MDFASFEEALKICLEAEDGSVEQDTALLYCIENAPPQLKEMLRTQFQEYRERKKHSEGCDCGSSH